MHSRYTPDTLKIHAKYNSRKLGENFQMNSSTTTGNCNTTPENYNTTPENYNTTLENFQKYSRTTPEKFQKNSSTTPELPK